MRESHWGQAQSPRTNTVLPAFLGPFRPQDLPLKAEHARITPDSVKQARDSRPRPSTREPSTKFIWIDPRHENGPSPYQPTTGRNSLFQARTETTPDKEGSLDAKFCATKDRRDTWNRS